jgi:hypothetical protein
VENYDLRQDLSAERFQFYEYWLNQGNKKVSDK